MEKVDNLETETLTKEYALLKKKEPNYNKTFRGLYISQDGKCDGIKKSRYVNGSINNFTTLLASNYREENLCNGVNMLFNEFSVEDMNVYIYAYFHKTVNGPVVVIKSDRTNVNENFHKSLSKLGKHPKQIKKCDSCLWILTDFETINNSFEFKNWCPLITCNLKVHKHLLCNLCKMQYYSDRNNKNRRNKESFWDMFSLILNRMFLGWKHNPLYLF